MTPGSAPLLANNPAIRRVIVWDKRGRDHGARGLRRMAEVVRAPDRHAIAYCVQGSWRSAALAVLAGYRSRAGFDTSAGRWLYTQRVRHRADWHHARRLLSLAGREVDAGTSPRPRLYPANAERLAVDDVLRKGPNDDRPLVALAPGSIWGTKRWPYFPALAAQLIERYRVTVIGSADDAGLAQEIRAATSDRVVDATGRLPLLASAELIGRCALLVTNDSAPQHLASAMGTPTLTVFGPTVPSFGFGPLAPRAAVVEHPTLPCRPCHPHGPSTCPLGHWRCMRELDVTGVLALATRLLEDP